MAEKAYLPENKKRGCFISAGLVTLCCVIMPSDDTMNSLI